MLSELQLQSLIIPSKHNGLISLFDHIIDEQYEYLVRPFYNLGGLFSELKKKKVRQLSEQELRHGAQNICNALRCIHMAGYLHGDVRP